MLLKVLAARRVAVLEVQSLLQKPEDLGRLASLKDEYAKKARVRGWWVLGFGCLHINYSHRYPTVWEGERSLSRVLAYYTRARRTMYTMAIVTTLCRACMVLCF